MTEDERNRHRVRGCMIEHPDWPVWQIAMALKLGRQQVRDAIEELSASQEDGTTIREGDVP